MTISFAASFYAANGGITWREPGEIRYPLPINARPLVVIDPEDREQVERLRKVLIDSGAFTGLTRGNVSKIQAALREFANPTPPKPDEPTGLGAVVEDADGERWLRFDCNTGGWPWIHDGPRDSRKYADINAVKVLSDGVTSC